MDFHSEMTQLFTALARLPLEDSRGRYFVAMQISGIMRSAPEMPAYDREFYSGIIGHYMPCITDQLQ